jgi:hypothetical protein
MGSSPTIANSCSCICWAGSTASTPISPDIDEQIEARLTPFMWIDIVISATEASGALSGGSTQRKSLKRAEPAALFA